MLGYVGMAQERPAPADDPALARQLAQARLAAERARDHVAQLLAFSRPRRGERRLLAHRRRCARQALQLLRPNLPSSIAVECSDGAPPTRTALPPVVADPVQLEQVLFNLCINARDAIREHGTHPAADRPLGRRRGHCASCSARLDGSALGLGFEVADDGCGMPREVMERMFEPFFTTKEVGRGTGMGLAMVHGIVHDHGGHIQVDVRAGPGSAFRVLLPAAAEDTPQAAAARRPQPPPRRPPQRCTGRVLLVEDEAIVSDYMVDLLGGWGLEVVLERDPLAAAAAPGQRDERVRPAADRPDHARHDRPGAGAAAPCSTGPRCRCCCTPATRRTSTRQELAASGVTRAAAQADRRRDPAPGVAGTARALKSPGAYMRNTKSRPAEITANTGVADTGATLPGQRAQSEVSQRPRRYPRSRRSP